MLRVNLTVPYQSTIDVVNAHSTMVRTADAAECRPVPSSPCVVDVNELLSCVSHNRHEPSWSRVVVCGLALGEDRCSCYETAQQGQPQNVRHRYRNKGSNWCRHCFLLLNCRPNVSCLAYLNRRKWPSRTIIRTSYSIAWPI